MLMRWHYLVTLLVSATVALDCDVDQTQSRWLPLSHWNAVQVTKQCGNKQNRFVQFTNGASYCVLYRANLEQVASELLAHRLAQLLRIEDVLPVAVHTFNSSASTWRAVLSDLLDAGWKDGHPILFVPFLPSLKPVYFPPEIANSLTSRTDTSSNPIDSATMKGEQIKSAQQFTDLIVFDYLTGNTDRTVSNLHSLQWNDETLSFPVRNVFLRADESLVLLDNESGMLHGYRLLDRFGHYLDRLLNSTCAFRPQLADSVQLTMSLLTQPGTDLRSLFSMDTLNNKWPYSVTRAFIDSLPVLTRRLAAVRDHFEYCVRRRELLAAVSDS